MAPAGLAFAVLGLALFVYFVRRAGVGEIVEGIRRLGAGFLLILLISGVRPAVRTLAWMLCVEAPYRLKFREAFKAYMTGDAVSNVVPLGMVIGEPAKAALVRDSGLPMVVGLSALAIEYLYYCLSVAFVIVMGVAALLWSFSLSDALRWASIGVLVGVVSTTLGAFLVVRRQWKFMSGAVERLSRRGVGRRVLTPVRRERVRAVEDRIYGFYARHRAHLLPIMALETCFHLAGVAEVYVTLFYISDVAPTLLAAFVLESVNRIINIVFKFVPLRVGVDEAGTGLLAGALQLGVGSGVTLAIIRKARVVAWVALGMLFLVGRGLSVRGVIHKTEEAVAQDEAGARESKIGMS